MFDDTFEKTLKISIHALLAESDPFRLLESQNAPIFLSTLSLRRATKEDINMARPKLPFLSTLSLRRATDKLSAEQQTRAISIHALLAESDVSWHIRQ